MPSAARDFDASFAIEKLSCRMFGGADCCHLNTDYLNTTPVW
jgi:hypothetical protein